MKKFKSSWNTDSPPPNPKSAILRHCSYVCRGYIPFLSSHAAGPWTWDQNACAPSCTCECIPTPRGIEFSSHAFRSGSITRSDPVSRGQQGLFCSFRSSGDTSSWPCNWQLASGTSPWSCRSHSHHQPHCYLLQALPPSWSPRLITPARQLLTHSYTVLKQMDCNPVID